MEPGAARLLTEYRGKQVPPMFGNEVVRLAYLITARPVPPLRSHIALHLAAGSMFLRILSRCHISSLGIPRPAQAGTLSTPVRPEAEEADAAEGVGLLPVEPSTITPRHLRIRV